MDKLLALLKLDALQGYRTYVIAATLIVLVLIEKGAGIDLPGVDFGDDWLAFILAALGLGAARAKYTE